MIRSTFVIAFITTVGLAAASPSEVCEPYPLYVWGYHERTEIVVRCVITRNGRTIDRYDIPGDAGTAYLDSLELSCTRARKDGDTPIRLDDLHLFRISSDRWERCVPNGSDLTCVTVRHSSVGSGCDYWTYEEGRYQKDASGARVMTSLPTVYSRTRGMATGCGK